MLLPNELIRLFQYWDERIKHEFPEDEPFVWRLKITPAEYEQLRSRLKQWCELQNGKPVFYHTWAKLLIIYIAEWFKREYEGNGNGLRVLEGIGMKSTEGATRRIWEESKLSDKFLYTHKKGNRKSFLHSIYALGGLPMQDVDNDNFKHIIKVLQNASTEEEAHLFENIREDKNEAFADSLRNENGSLHQYCLQLFRALRDGNREEMPMSKEDCDAYSAVINTAFEKEPFKISYEVYRDSGKVTVIPSLSIESKNNCLSYDQVHAYHLLGQKGLDEIKKCPAFNLSLYYGEKEVRSRLLFWNTYDKDKKSRGFLSMSAQDEFTLEPIPFDSRLTFKLVCQEGGQTIQTFEVPKFLQLYSVEGSSVWTMKKSRKTSCKAVLLREGEIAFESAEGAEVVEGVERLQDYDEYNGVYRWLTMGRNQVHININGIRKAIAPLQDEDRVYFERRRVYDYGDEDIHLPLYLLMHYAYQGKTPFSYEINTENGLCKRPINNSDFKFSKLNFSYDPLSYSCELPVEDRTVYLDWYDDELPDDAQECKGEDYKFYVWSYVDRSGLKANCEGPKEITYEQFKEISKATWDDLDNQNISDVNGHNIDYSDCQWQDRVVFQSLKDGLRPTHYHIPKMNMDDCVYVHEDWDDNVSIDDNLKRILQDENENTERFLLPICVRCFEVAMEHDLPFAIFYPLQLLLGKADNAFKLIKAYCAPRQGRKIKTSFDEKEQKAWGRFAYELGFDWFFEASCCDPRTFGEDLQEIQKTLCKSSLYARNNKERKALDKLVNRVVPHRILFQLREETDTIFQFLRLESIRGGRRARVRLIGNEADFVRYNIPFFSMITGEHPFQDMNNILDARMNQE